MMIDTLIIKISEIVDSWRSVGGSASDVAGGRVHFQLCPFRVQLPVGLKGIDGVIRGV